MIKVNLNRNSGGEGASSDLSGTLKKLFKRGGGDGGSDNGGGGFSFSGVKEKIDEYSGIVKTIGSIAVFYFLLGVRDDFQKDALKKIEVNIQKINSEIAAINQEASKYQDYSQKKEQLEKDESLIRQKLGVLAKVMEGRTGPVKVMLQMSQIIPKNVWLTEFSYSTKDVRLMGLAMGYEDISEFLKAVQSSSYFTNVNLKTLEQSNKENTKIRSFSINALRRLE